MILCIAKYLFFFIPLQQNSKIKRLYIRRRNYDEKYYPISIVNDKIRKNQQDV